MSFAGRKVQGINVEHVSHDTETFSYEDRGTNEEVSSRDPQKQIPKARKAHFSSGYCF